ncbi:MULTISPECIES: GbsR/MarR family transcriptional regulator [unclassified Curtobacterium]|uniref:GbsR/MarR family transcriptional regulator n=1 Tax=unclassified Curtobacterium TaxID=257496 RepID=UPI0015E8E632|nr:MULTISPECIES: transcriptional regulator [unclassified Curtobacterium]WIB64352.1 transcriptional regulator [Curtobacterium sp. MCBD17_040]WIB68214.1 transcriptional regulator [Curtobacterium sp. MCBD17_035]WIE55385.1 transcriptional regulator [Curtobacterium sp. MCBD17_003]
MSTDERTPADATGVGPVLDPARQAFVEEFAIMLQGSGFPLMDGRVLAYLIMTRAPYSSSADIAAGLEASSGAVSMATRHLVVSGFIKRHFVPGERSHYFRAENDVWGSWLAGERRYLDRERDVIEQGLAALGDSDDPADAPIRERLVNGRDYMTWLHSHHRKMLAEWEAFKAARDAGTDPEERP